MYKLKDGIVQVLVVGGLAFCGPGIFNALNGLGGAGNKNADFANTANACLYATFTVFGYFGGVAFNIFGNKVLMFVGGLTYAAYAGTQYAAGNVASLGWLAPVGGVVLGFGAGWFWTAQGAMILAYSTKYNRAKYIAVFWVVFNLGGMIGGFITFAVNYNNNAGTANSATYFTFIAIMAAGAISGLFLLVPPNKVVRADKGLVEFEKTNHWADEIKGAIKVICNKYMALLSLLFIASNFFYTYQFNGLNGGYFNIRTRGLNSALYWGSQMLGSVLLTLILDKQSFSLKKRNVLAWLWIFLEFNAALGIGLYVQFFFEGNGYDKATPISNPIDYQQGSRFWAPFLAFMLYGIGDAMIQTYAYWVMSSIARGNTKVCARYSAFYKGVQSGGATVAWSIDLNLSITYRIQFILMWILFGVAMIGPLLVSFGLRDFEEDGSTKGVKVAAGSECRRSSVSSSYENASSSSYNGARRGNGDIDIV